MAAATLLIGATGATDAVGTTTATAAAGLEFGDAPVPPPHIKLCSLMRSKAARFDNQ
jgi:hypothetical protein